jgi:hypothetical protein
MPQQLEDLVFQGKEMLEEILKPELVAQLQQVAAGERER